MKNKEIHDRRVKGYFVEATKEILKSEGIKAMSVRTISDRAGYSYATLYNYFSDLSELIYMCVDDFLADCSRFIGERVRGLPVGKERIKGITLAYMDYFVEYPGLFDLLYLEKMGQLGGKQETADTIVQYLDSQCAEDWNLLAADSKAKPKQINFAKETLRSITVGVLVIYLNRMHPNSHKGYLELANRQIDAVLNEF